MPRILVVSPRFPPVSAPDMHRVRLVAPWMGEFRWQPEIIAADPESLPGARDEWLLKSWPRDIPIHHAPVWSQRWASVPGLGSLGMRSLAGLNRVGKALLARKRYDLVYFSTTAFEVHVLGPLWRRVFGVPFVMDYQDPWVTEYYRDNPHVPRPGGALKYGLNDALNRRLEPHVLRHCSGITSVSRDYPVQLKRRYPWFAGAKSLITPFPAPTADFARLRVAAKIRDPQALRWVYVGVVPPMMSKALDSFFLALREHADPALLERLQIDFVGTSYATGTRARPTVEPIAGRHGLRGIVRECVARVPYHEALQRYVQADAILAFGTDDPHYTASKIYPCLLARKPLLAIYHAQSPVIDLLREVGGGNVVPFAADEGNDAVARRIADAWLTGEAYRSVVPLDEATFAAHGDRASAQRLCEFFDECLGIAA